MSHFNPFVRGNFHSDTTHSLAYMPRCKSNQANTINTNQYQAKYRKCLEVGIGLCAKDGSSRKLAKWITLKMLKELVQNVCVCWCVYNGHTQLNFLPVDFKTQQVGFKLMKSGFDVDMCFLHDKTFVENVGGSPLMIIRAK